MPLTLLMIALLGGMAPAKPEAVITNPEWVAKPSGDDVSRYFPDRALREAVDGAATLTCEVLETGDLTDCKVVEESPADYGFGAAALGLSVKFKMRPRLVDGKPVSGAMVRIPIKFVAPEDDGALPVMPEVSEMLACYGHFAAKAEGDPIDKDARARAVIFAVGANFGAYQLGWTPSMVEEGLVSARKASKAGAPEPECMDVSQAAEQMRAGPR